MAVYFWIFLKIMGIFKLHNHLLVTPTHTNNWHVKIWKNKTHIFHHVKMACGFDPENGGFPSDCPI